MVPPVEERAAQRGSRRDPLGIVPGVLIGAATGTLATLAAALSSPELYLDEAP